LAESGRISLLIRYKEKADTFSRSAEFSSIPCYFLVAV
jgi:hypothetical protein